MAVEARFESLTTVAEKHQIKVTIIHGTKDQLVPYSNVAFVQKELVNAKSIDLISIKEGNHFIPWTHFERIRDALLNLKLE